MFLYAERHFNNSSFSVVASGIEASLTTCVRVCVECRNGHTVSQQDLFNPISDAIITDSF